MKSVFCRSFLSLQALLFVSLVLVAFHSTPARAQNYCGAVTAVNFNGANPAASVVFDSAGNMYGTTSSGGTVPAGGTATGTIWKYTPSTGLTTLFTFSGSSSPSNNGYNARSPLVMDGQGNLYGATYGGGNAFSLTNNQQGWGTLFQLSPGGQFTELYQFSGLDGANPSGTVLLDSQGNLWGTTNQGGSAFNNLGSNGFGTIFKFSGGAVTSPVSFNVTDGELPGSGLATDGANFYGTTNEGGANDFGTLFQYSPATGQLTTLFNFNRNPNGSFPSGNVLYDGNGNLYGTTSEGGSHSSPSNACCGTVWKYSLSTGQMTTLVNFDGDTVAADGLFPTSGIVLDGNGNIIGTTSQGGSFSDGIVYKYSSSGVLSTLVTFTGSNGQVPGGLARDSSGNLWGITSQGGTSGSGTLYELTANPSGSTCGGTAVSSLALNPSSVQNGATSTGTVTLNTAAPSSGAVVGLTSDSSFAIVPSSVMVPAGATTATFQVNTNGFVLSSTAATITATLGNSTAQSTLTITTGVPVKSISMNPSSVTGGSPATGTVALTTAAPSGGNEVLISTNNNDSLAVDALQVPITVTVPAGQTSVSFSFGTRPVTSSVNAPVYAQSGGTTASTNLTVNPTKSSGGGSGSGGGGH